jgi:hypothetical protein
LRLRSAHSVLDRYRQLGIWGNGVVPDAALTWALSGAICEVNANLEDDMENYLMMTLAGAAMLLVSLVAVRRGLRSIPSRGYRAESARRLRLARPASGRSS